jgi:hypothetical protein
MNWNLKNPGNVFEITLKLPEGQKCLTLSDTNICIDPPQRTAIIQVPFVDDLFEQLVKVISLPTQFEEIIIKKK